MKRVIKLISLIFLITLITSCDDEDSSVIEYPENGSYGKNLLYLKENDTIYAEQEYSLAVNLSHDASLKIVFRNGNWEYNSSSAINWNISNFDESDSSQTFISIQNGINCDLSMRFHLDLKKTYIVDIEYYEDDSINPTKTVQAIVINNIVKLKKGCINAAIIGIEREIEINEYWLEHENDSLDSLKIIARLNTLENKLIKYQNQLSNIDLYELPEKCELEKVWVTEPLQIDTQLDFAGGTRSGPFYFITGINNDYKDYELILQSIYYTVIYLVYPRFGTFAGTYVYIHQLEYIGSIEY
ncbi:hypothetical protein ACFLSA_05675 [Bacteroidota bacterium]